MTSDGLALRDIGVRFGGLVALEGVSLDVPPGTVVGVIGPNGAGKTTLFNVVCGFVKPHTGTLTLDGTPLRPRPHDLVRHGIGRTLQGLGIFAGLSVLENVMVGATVTARAGLGAALLGLPASDRDEQALRERAMARLDELGIAAHAGKPAGALPFGLRKRVALARALAGEPRLLLLDEPASGLGTDDVDELVGLIRGLPGRSTSTAVMLVEHHMDLVMRVCDRIVVLDFGRVIATGTPDQVRDDPAVNDAYLGTEVEA